MHKSTTRSKTKKNIVEKKRQKRQEEGDSLMQLLRDKGVHQKQVLEEVSYTNNCTYLICI